MYIGNIGSGDEAPEVVEAITNRFGWDGMLRLYQRHSLDGLQVFNGLEDDFIVQVCVDKLLISNGYSKG